MISLVLIIILIECITHVTNKPCRIECNINAFKKRLLHDAKQRYINAYVLTDNNPEDLSKLFDYLISTTEINGVVNLNNHAKFRGKITDSILNTNYPNASYRAEALFVFDFVMEAYHHIGVNDLNYEYDLSILLRN